MLKRVSNFFSKAGRFFRCDVDDRRVNEEAVDASRQVVTDEWRRDGFERHTRVQKFRRRKVVGALRQVTIFISFYNCSFQLLTVFKNIKI